MSYVWSAEEIARYKSFYYNGVVTRGANAYLSFRTTAEFARSVLPPCLEVATDPQVSISFGSFMEIYDNYPNRPGRDTAALVGINAQLDGREGTYFLTVIETEDVNVVTGREIWGMPKKPGTVTFWEDGRRLWGFVERKGHTLVEIEAELGPEVGEQDDSTELYFELRGHFASDLSTLSVPELVTFEMPSKTDRFRELTAPHVTLHGSPFDRGVGTIPLGEFVSGGLSGGETGYRVADVRDLSNDGNDYTPYLLSRFYDTWEDYAVRSDRQPSKTRL
jgi:acetoacetate decarboxylase